MSHPEEEIELKELIKQIRQQKTIADASDDVLQDLKEKLRVFMIDSGIKEYDGVEIRRAVSFDLELLRLEHPDLFEKYCTRIERITYKNEWNSVKLKEYFIKTHSEIYRDTDYFHEKKAGVYGL